MAHLRQRGGGCCETGDDVRWLLQGGVGHVVPAVSHRLTDGAGARLRATVRRRQVVGADGARGIRVLWAGLHGRAETCIKHAMLGGLSQNANFLKIDIFFKVSQSSMNAILHDKGRQRRGLLWAQTCIKHAMLRGLSQNTSLTFLKIDIFLILSQSFMIAILHDKGKKGDREETCCELKPA